MSKVEKKEKKEKVEVNRRTMKGCTFERWRRMGRQPKNMAKGKRQEVKRLICWVYRGGKSAGNEKRQRGVSG